MTLRRALFWSGLGMAAFVVLAVLGLAAAIYYEPQLLRPLLLRALTPEGGTASIAGLKATFHPPSLTLWGIASESPDRGEVVKLDVLRLEPIPSRILSDQPWLRYVEARGLVYERLRALKPEAQPDLKPLGWLFQIEDLLVSEARVRVALPDGVFEVEGGQLSLTPDEGGIRIFDAGGYVRFRRRAEAMAEGVVSARGTITHTAALEAEVRLAPARFDLGWLSGESSLRTKLRLTESSIEAEEFNLLVPEPRTTLELEPERKLGPIRIRGTASASLEGRRPRLDLRELDLAGLLRAHGRMSGPAVPALSGVLEGEFPQLERLRFLVARFFPEVAKGLGLKGALPFRLALAPLRTEPLVSLELLPNHVALAWPEAGVSSVWTGSVKVSGAVSGWREGKVGVEGLVQAAGDVQGESLTVRGFRLKIPLAGELVSPIMPNWRLSVAPGEAFWEGRPLSLGGLEISGTASRKDGGLRVADLEVRSEEVGRLTGELDAEPGGITGRLGGESLPANALASVAAAVTGRDWQAWSASGVLDLDLALAREQEDRLFSATMVLRRMGFRSPPGDLIGQNMDGRFGLEGRLKVPHELRADLTIRGGEALWGTVYVDLGKNPVDLRANVVRASSGDYPEVSLEAEWTGFGRLSLKAEAKREEAGWRHQGRLRLEEATLEPVFRTFMRDPLAAAHPDLAKLEVGGTAGMDLSFSGSEEEVRLEGRVRVHSAGLSGNGEAALSGLDLDLPVSYTLGAADPAEPRPLAPEAWGRLDAKEVRVAGQVLGPLHMPVVLVPNRLYVGGDLDATAFGAKLLLSGFEVTEPLSSRLRANLEARVAGFDLSLLPGKASALEGAVGGVLDPVSITTGRISAEGALAGDFFGGRIRIDHLTVDRPFSPGPEVGADLEFALVDMERLSAALDVGRVTGRVSGSVQGLRVAYGQPVAFRLRLASVPVKGVKQLVSLKAVNSISLLSTGSAMGGLGLSIMTTVFREFAYQKIGLACDLKNDVFTVRGLIQEGDTEYLVKRPLLSGIDVINRNPNNRISFSDMLERLKRVMSEHAQ